MKHIRESRFNVILMRGAVAVLLIVLFGMKGFATQPDFAFPKQVEKNAAEQLVKCIRDKDQPGVIQSMIRLVIANSITEPDSISSSLSLMQKARQSLTFPYDRLSLLIEARFYQSVYDDNPYIFTQRKLPAHPVSQNLMEWSADQFVNKIEGLLSRACNNWEAPSGVHPISEIASLLTDSERASANGWTVKDFVAFTALDIASHFYTDSEDTIRFFPSGDRYSAQTASEKMKKLASAIVENWIKDARGRENYDVYGEALIMKSQLKPGSLRAQFLWGMSERLQDTPVSVILLYALPPYRARLEDLNGNVTLKDYYKRASEAVGKFPDSPYSGLLSERLKEMSLPELELKADGKVGGGKPVSVEAVLHNTETAGINLYKLIYKGGGNLIDSRRNPEIKFAGSFPVKSGRHENSVRDDFPYSDTVRLSLPALDYGKYALLPDNVTVVSDMMRNIDYYATVFEVTDINAVVSSGPGSGELFVFKAEDMRPVAGAEVRCYGMERNNPLITTLKTNSEGMVELPEKNCLTEVVTSMGRWNNSYYTRGSLPKKEKIVRGTVLMDKSIAHPGDSIGFGAIIYNQCGSDLSSAENVRVRCELRDANREVRDSLSLVTDSTGRIAAGFAIPDNGLLGSWSINVMKEPNDRGNRYDRNICSGHIEVADYKRPTFFVAYDEGPRNFKPGENVTVSGKVMTWSGMPVGGAEISFSVLTNPDYRRARISPASYSGVLKCDDNGNFRILLPTAALKGTPYENASYRLRLTATSSAGESQEAPNLYFSIGEATRLTVSVPTLFNVEKEGNILKCRVLALDCDGKPTERSVTYCLTDHEGKPIESGSFITPTLELKVSNLRSGLYHLDLNDGEVIRDVVILSGSEGDSPAGITLWIPEKEVIAVAGSDEVKINFGTDNPSVGILCQVSDLTGSTSTNWVKADSSGMVRMKVKAPKDRERRFVRLMTTRGFTIHSGMITVLPASERDTVKIEAVSFRDKLIPGSGEEWTFKVVKGARGVANPSVMAVMTDKSLNSIAPLRWMFNPSGWLDRWPVSSLSGNALDDSFRRFNLVNWICNNLKVPEYPMFDFYGMSLYGGRNGHLMVRGARKYKSEESIAHVPLSANTDMMAYDAEAMSATSAGAYPAMDSDNFHEESAESESETVGELDQDFRESECPVAFFRPMITGDDDGAFMIKFNVPDFNTTWSLQMVAYDHGMSSASLMLDAVASKPLMLSLNAPRFARTGDRIEIVASIFNNSEKDIRADLLIELIDRLTGKTLGSKRLAVDMIKSGATGNFSMVYDVNDCTTEIVARAKVSDGETGDGEQVPIAVLPSSVPVVDTYNFYMNPGEDEFTIKLPEFKKGSNVTFSFCNNPVWYSLSSLPGPDGTPSENILSIAESYYSNSVATGLAFNNPELINSLQALFDSDAKGEDSFLESRLVKNSQLTGVPLSSTPWVNNAADERRRLLSLENLVDPSAFRHRGDELAKKIAERQDADGLLRWFPGMEGSPYITLRVLRLIANLNHYGYVKNDPAISRMVRNAVKGLDNFYLERRKLSKGDYSLTEMIDYLQMRSDLSNGAESLASVPSGEMGRFAADVVRRMSQEWKQLIPGIKAECAMLLQEESASPGLTGAKRTRLKGEILQSLKEFSTETPDRGISYPLLKRSIGFLSPVAETAVILEAFARCSDDKGMIDGLRQWLILQREISDWGDGAISVGVVNAILSTGVKWLGSDNNLSVTLNEVPLDVDMKEALTGNILIDLDSQTASEGVMKLKRSSSGPAWGGVISQYVAHVREVTPTSTDGIKVSRKLYRLEEHEGRIIPVETGHFKTGDKVRVMITLEVSDNMSYVEVTDMRSAALEPVEQLSGLVFTEAGPAYREVKDSETNLFFRQLRSGIHILTYDCYVSNDGDFSSGMTKVISAYAPTYAARSGGGELTSRREIE